MTPNINHSIDPTRGSRFWHSAFGRQGGCLTWFMLVGGQSSSVMNTSEQEQLVKEGTFLDDGDMTGINKANLCWRGCPLHSTSNSAIMG